MSNIFIDVLGALDKHEKETGKKITIAQLQEKIGVSRQTMMNWQKGERLATVESIMDISKYLKVPMDKIIKKQPKTKKE